MKERQGEIYVIHNLLNDKEYSGQTVRGYLVRLKGHIKCMLKGDQRPLYKAMRKCWRKYGDLRGFTIKVPWVGPESKLNAAEKRTIRQRKTFIDTGWGYNLTTGGDHVKLSKATIKKIRVSTLRNFANEKFHAQFVAAISTPEVLASRQIAQCLRWLDSAMHVSMSQAQQCLEVRALRSKSLKLAHASKTIDERSAVGEKIWITRRAHESAMSSEELLMLHTKRSAATVSWQAGKSTEEFRIAGLKGKQTRLANLAAMSVKDRAAAIAKRDKARMTMMSHRTPEKRKASARKSADTRLLKASLMSEEERAIKYAKKSAALKSAWAARTTKERSAIGQKVWVARKERTTVADGKQT